MSLELDRKVAEALGLNVDAPANYSGAAVACADLKRRLREAGITFIIAYLEDGMVAPIVGKGMTLIGPVELPGAAHFDRYETEEEAVCRLFIGAWSAGLLDKKVDA